MKNFILNINKNTFLLALFYFFFKIKNLIYKFYRINYSTLLKNGTNQVKRKGSKSFVVTKLQNFPLPMNQRLESEITSVLSKFPIVKNLSRKKFICSFILGLIKSRNIQFCSVAQHLNFKAKLSSNEVRIQDFFREVNIDYFYVALLLLQFLPTNKKLRLCLDRTEWDFGSCQINILMVVVPFKKEKKQLTV